MNKFIFESYKFDKVRNEATFNYAFNDGRTFKEVITFERTGDYNNKILDRALFLAFIMIGVSYYKTFPSVEVELNVPIDNWQADFFSKVYQEGLSQFAFENELTRSDLAHFKPNRPELVGDSLSYNGEGIIALQSGGKDSLLTASLLKEKGKDFTAWYVANGNYHPQLLDKIGSELAISVRLIDYGNLKQAVADGGKNGHVPVTYIIQSLAVIQAILLGKKYVLTSIAHEGEEPHHHIDDMSVTHQWSKTWTAEQLFSEYIKKYVTSDLLIGSPLRSYSELRVAELFVDHSWKKYGHDFSSCNVANYKQGNDNSVLHWCSNCPKCANSYLLFAPFVPARELKKIFNDEDLFTKSSLERTFKGLLGIDGVPKPFECIGEIEELRLAYHKAQENGGYGPLPFEVPDSNFDYMQIYPSQEWATKMLQ